MKHVTTHYFHILRIKGFFELPKDLFCKELKIILI